MDFEVYFISLKEKRLAKCPTCGKNVSKPDKTLKNNSFCIESYTCENCKTKFKKTNYS